jgi:hypothetical protein
MYGVLALTSVLSLDCESVVESVFLALLLL